VARWRLWLGVALAAAALPALAGLAGAGGPKRPAERASPAPQVNPKAVVWRTPAPPADAEAGDVWASEGGAEMVYVPAGEFLRGSPAGKGDPDEHPQRRVSLDAYWIDKRLVTVADYRKFCQATGRKMPVAPAWGWKEDHPVVNVTPLDAADYARWAGKRLSTEAEWEKAARGTEGGEYPWGNGWDAQKCANAQNSHSTKPVGSYPAGASPYGALDMAGNAWEWCADRYDERYYASAPARNPTGPTSGTWWVIRGGAWDVGGPTWFRCARRDYERVLVTGNDNYDGFRCVREAASRSRSAGSGP